MSLELHVTGESEFIDDIRPMAGELAVGYVGSPVSHGELQSIDSSEALKLPGVVGVYTARDLHKKLWGTIVQDQPVVVEKFIGYRDEPICIVAAESREILERARKLVKFKIKELPAIRDIDTAIAKNSILHSPTPFQCGDVDAIFANKKNIPHIHRGEMIIGGQEHFYLESQASLVYPVDGDGLKVVSSSQHPTETQHVVAHAVGLPFHKVTCEVKRMGGAFGGKESQAAPFAAMAAIVAHKTGRPARIVLTKDDDMCVTGKRHPFKAFFEVAFNDDGKLLGLKLKLYADGGAYTDLSPSILDRAMFHADGCYLLENARIEGWVCKTHTHSNTAFRGFGGPQGAIVIESIIEDIARILKKDPAGIRLLNLYDKSERAVTPYGQRVTNNLLPELFAKALKSSDYDKRRREIVTFNKNARGKLRGISITGCKFGISFTTRFLNQGNALVNIHRDGTVQVSTGATDMGQGINTKLAIVASRAFGIPVEDVNVTITSTEKNANTSPTAASSGSDINGAAVQVACDKILLRLKQVAVFHFSGRKLTVKEELEVREHDLSKAELAELENIVFENGVARNKKTGATIVWRDLLSLAYLNRISISDYGHMKTTGLAFDRAKGHGDAFKYFTPGAAVSEVSVDTYSGEVKILRTDIVMDLGRPLHHGVDIGQITGGFVQGAGWMTTEKLFYADDGFLVSHSPTTYKIPNIQDTPRVFNVSLIENDLNEGVILRSKAVGEPPLLLSASVFMAIKDAISYRTDEKTVALQVPATPEEVLMRLRPHEL